MKRFETGVNNFSNWCQRDPVKAFWIITIGAVALYAILYLAIAGPRDTGSDGPEFLGNDIYSSSECEQAYNEDYLLKGTAGAMTLEEYCENLNDTSYLDGYEPK